jgi:ribosome biogenesis GTPase
MSRDQNVHHSNNLAVQYSAAASLHEGIVIRKSQGTYTVLCGGRNVACTVTNKLRKQLLYPIADPGSIRPHVVDVRGISVVDPVAVGDQVRFVAAHEGTGMIVDVLPRRSQLTRRAAGVKPLAQVIVANADQIVVVMAAAQPSPSWELVDRYLAAAEEAGIPTCVVVTKLDLVDAKAIRREARDIERLGYVVLLTSAVSGLGVDALHRQLTGRLSVVAGKSGVGKTTLLNAMQPELGLRVSQVSALTGKGKHTTSHLEMFPLDGGGAIVDTPGMREFGLWNVPAEKMAHLFREIRPCVGQCRFGLSCSHTHEPGCAVKGAVERGEISERRYRSYLRMRDG